jgi:hypothetical protein
VPKGITKVFRAETDFVGTLTRTQLNGPGDIPALHAIQGQYVLTPLSRFTGQPAPPPAPAVAWPAWDASKAEGIGFITYLNALLPFMPVVPSERAMRPGSPASASAQVCLLIRRGWIRSSVPPWRKGWLRPAGT